MAGGAGQRRLVEATVAALGLAIAPAPHALAQMGQGPALERLLESPPPWAAADYAREKGVAQACAPGVPLAVAHGRTVFAGRRGSIRGMAANGEGVLAVMLSGDSLNAETLVWTAGLRQPPLRLATGDKVGLSADRAELAWIGLRGVTVMDLRSGAQTLIPRPDCFGAASPRWFGGDVMLSCDEPRLEIFRRSGDGFEPGAAFDLPHAGQSLAENDAAIARLATVDESGTRFVWRGKVYADAAAVTAAGGTPDFPESAGERIFRTGSHLLRIEGNESGDYGPPALVGLDADTGATQARLTLPSPRCHVRDVAVSRDGQAFALLLSDDASVVLVIDAGTLATRAVYSLARPALDPAEFLAFLPDDRLVSASDMSVQVHDPAQPRR